MPRWTPTLPLQATVLLLTVLSAPAFATTLTVTDPAGQPLALVMLRERPAAGPNLDTSDNGYPAPGVARTVAPELTRFRPRPLRTTRSARTSGRRATQVARTQLDIGKGMVR